MYSYLGAYFEIDFMEFDYANSTVYQANELGSDNYIH